MLLEFDYQMQIRYSMPVERCFYTIKCIPKETGSQRLLEKEIQMKPQSQWMEGTDGWGNKKIYGCIPEPHDEFIFRIHGKVLLGNVFPEKESGNISSPWIWPDAKVTWKNASGSWIACIRNLPMYQIRRDPQRKLRRRGTLEWVYARTLPIFLKHCSVWQEFRQGMCAD